MVVVRVGERRSLKEGSDLYFSGRYQPTRHEARRFEATTICYASCWLSSVFGGDQVSEQSVFSLSVDLDRKEPMRLRPASYKEWKKKRVNMHVGRPVLQ